MWLQIRSLSRLLNRFQLISTHNCRSLPQYYPIDDIVTGLTEEQIKLREAIFNVVQKELAPKAQEIDRNNHFDDLRGFWKILGNIGALGITVDPKYGGTGGSYLDHIIVTEEISRASGSIGLSYNAHSILCVHQISKHGTEEQKQKYLPKLCSGEHVGALTMSESGSGSDAVSMKLRADKKGDHYVLNGSKFWTINGPDADVLVVYAKTDFTKKPQHGITGFLIEKGFKGFSTLPKKNTLGMRGSDTCEIIFEDCVVPKENVLGTENKGVYILMSGIDYERVVIAAAPIGLMQAACDIAFNYAHERKQFGQKNGEFQMIQSKLANMYTTLGASRCYLYSVAKACNKKQISSKDRCSVFMFVAERTTQMALDAIQILGGKGCINDYPVGRILRDAKLYEIGGGTIEIRKMVIGRSLNKEYS